MGGEMAFVGATIPQGAVIVFLSLFLLRVFRYFSHILSGLGLLGVLTPLFGHEWNGLTMTVAVISFVIGAGVSKYMSEENPPVFLFLVVLGIAMVIMNWSVIVAGIGSGPSLGGVGNIMGLNNFYGSMLNAISF